MTRPPRHRSNRRVVNATINAPCPHGPWPARECYRCDAADDYVAPLVLLGGLTIAWCIALGGATVYLGGLAWNAVRGHLGG